MFITAPLSQFKLLTGPLDGDLEMYIIFLSSALLLALNIMYVFGIFLGSSNVSR
jgi:hypothetical protein